MKDEKIASKEACRILREHFIGLDHPNIDAYDDTYVINNYPFEWSLYMDGWKSENGRLKAESEWISVEDALPEYGEWYLVNTNKRGVIECFYDGNDIWLTAHGDLKEDEDITHWQPLPKSPQK